MASGIKHRIDRQFASDPLTMAMELIAIVIIVGVFWLPATIRADSAVASWLLLAIVALTMLGRWWLPFPSVLVAGLVTIAANMLDSTDDPMIATAWCLYPLAVNSAFHTRKVVITTMAAFLLGTMLVSAPSEGADSQHLVISAGVISGSWLLGTTTGQRLHAMRNAAMMNMRLDIARDVHDIVGHSLGVIHAEAGITRQLDDTTNQELRESLEDIEHNARGALVDIQRLVRTLRAVDSQDALPFISSHTLADIEALIESTRSAGLNVRADIRIKHVPDILIAVTYRIVQEALANVVRHAPYSSCLVDIRETNSNLIVRVSNSGQQSVPPIQPGYGLQGIRERATLVDGNVNWGIEPSGDFMVEVTLPMEMGL